MDNDKTPGVAATNEALASQPEPPEPILKFFSTDHLPAKLSAISHPFGLLADVIVKNLPRCAERTVALRKLLESKDAAVRAAID
jgi:hypothetical protein